MSRERSGPRQPGGGRQMAGLRHRNRGKGRGGGRDGSQPRHFRSGGAGEGTHGKPPATPRREPSPTTAALTVRNEGKVETTAVAPDESGMRVDRFFEARFPGLSFSHIQRI